MMKVIVLIAACLTAFMATAGAEEVRVSGFPVGVGGSVSEAFFAPYSAGLQALADTLAEHPLMLVVITGSADGLEYREHHDAKNPSLALGRAHVLRNLLVDKFHVDPHRIVIQSIDVLHIGSDYRSANVRLVRELSDLEGRVAALEEQEPVEKHFTEVREAPQPAVDLGDYLGLQFSGGLSTSPFGGLPMVAGAVSWKRTVYLEGVFGHTTWNNEYKFQEALLDTKRRLAGGQIIVFPLESVPVGAVAGWMRFEEISEYYYKYVRMSEGPVLGLRVVPVDFLAVTGLYNPSRHRITENVQSVAKNGQFMLTVAAFIEIGGSR